MSGADFAHRDHGQPVLIRARRAVILSTGGFIFNRGLIRKQAPVKALPGLVVETWILATWQFGWIDWSAASA